jgi:UDP-N-acetylglucosamine 2-epimerase (non-hydrolysing)
VQTAKVMLALEPLLQADPPDLVLVYGDVNSTLATALVAAKLGIRIGHVEAGLRSGDRRMPEELNREVTDRLSDMLFTPSGDAVAHLRAEGIPADQVHLVGNVMIDTLVAALPRAAALHAPQRHAVAPGEYAVVTLHRPSNVDDLDALKHLMTTLEEVARERPVLFPVHPRTRERLLALGWTDRGAPRLLPPLGYLEMLGLVREAGVVLTDSGGVQEETTFLGVPCLTIRPSTERPITCVLGTNHLVPRVREALLAGVRSSIAERRPHPPRIPLWDGAAGERIAELVAGPAPLMRGGTPTTVEEELSCVPSA